VLLLGKLTVYHRISPYKDTEIYDRNTMTCTSRISPYRVVYDRACLTWVITHISSIKYSTTILYKVLQQPCKIHYEMPVIEDVMF
jgi:hypothetical protein